ncbi:MAG: lysylphosphatidylglycerol synthase transmembrane domain-containing protein [Terrimicrobiaceae bacterium]
MLKPRFLLQSLASVVLLAFLLSRIEWRALGEIWQQVNLPLALTASLLTFLLIFLLAVRWRIFLTQQGIDMPLSSVLKLTWTGQFFNSFLPGSTGGDFSKLYQVCRRNPDRKTRAAVTVLLDRLSALAAMVVLAICSWVLGPSWKILHSGLISLKPLNWMLISLLILALSVVFAWLVRRFGSEPWRQQGERLRTALSTGFQCNAGTMAALFLAFVIHFVNFTIFFLFARALGMSLTFWQVLLILPVVFLLLLLPVTVNGHGLREVLLIFYFTQFGVHLAGGQPAGIAEIVISLTLLCVANDLLWSLPGGLLGLIPFRPDRT